MEQSKAMEYGSRKASSDVLKPRNIYIYIYIYIYIFIYLFINCNWDVTRWQYTFTHKQYIEQHK